MDGRRASSATSSTATSAAAPPTPTSPEATARTPSARPRPRSRPGCPRRSSSRRRSPTPSRPPCASTTRPSSTSASTCSRSPSSSLEVYEHSHAVQVDDDERCTVKTPGGNVTADHVVVATHYPFLDRALAFARVLPAALLRAPVPHHGRAAGGHVHQRRLADALGPLRPARRRGAAAGRRRGPQDRRGRRHRGALRARSSASPASTGTCSRSSTAGPRRTARRSTACPTSAR